MLERIIYALTAPTLFVFKIVCKVLIIVAYVIAAVVMAIICGVGYTFGFFFAKRPTIFYDDPPNHFLTDYKKWPIILGHRILPLDLVFLATLALCIYIIIMGKWH